MHVWLWKLPLNGLLPLLPVRSLLCTQALSMGSLRVRVPLSGPLLCPLLQIINGLVQTTGWPSVVTCLGNWFGKGR